MKCVWQPSNKPMQLPALAFQKEGHCIVNLATKQSRYALAAEERSEASYAGNGVRVKCFLGAGTGQGGAQTAGSNEPTGVGRPVAGRWAVGPSRLANGLTVHGVGAGERYRAKHPRWWRCVDGWSHGVLASPVDAASGVCPW
jgi:hypothetical protein